MCWVLRNARWRKVLRTYAVYARGWLLCVCGLHNFCDRERSLQDIPNRTHGKVRVTELPSQSSEDRTWHPLIFHIGPGSAAGAEGIPNTPRVPVSPPCLKWLCCMLKSSFFPWMRLIDPQLEPSQVSPLRARLDLGMMVARECSTAVVLKVGEISLLGTIFRGKVANKTKGALGEQNKGAKTLNH